jgi:hypothetical protein
MAAVCWTVQNDLLNEPDTYNPIKCGHYIFQILTQTGLYGITMHFTLSAKGKKFWTHILNENIKSLQNLRIRNDLKTCWKANNLNDSNMYSIKQMKSYFKNCTK